MSGAPRPAPLPSRRRARLKAALCSVLVAAYAHGAEYRPAGYEEWSGYYACEANERDPERWPAYRAQVSMIVEDGRADVVRETARVRETMQGPVDAEGRVALAGTGEWKGGASWRWAFEGRFSGQRFAAAGAMLSAQAGARVRACTMSLTRVAAADSRPGAATSAPAAAPEPMVTPAPTAPTPREPAVSPEASTAQKPIVEGLPPAAASPRKAPGATAAPATGGVETPLDLAPGAPAQLTGQVSHAAADRYHIAGSGGQHLTVALSAPGGLVRFDVYAPGAVARREQTAFIVQGARLYSGGDGAVYRDALPVDGRYLVVVRSADERTPYTLHVTLEDTEPAAAAGLPPQPAAAPSEPLPSTPLDATTHAGEPKRTAGAARQGAIALILIAAAAAVVALLQRRHPLPPPARHAAVAVIAVSGVVLLAISGRAPPVSPGPAEPAPAASTPAAAADAARAAPDAPALIGGTFVCGAARAGETHIVSTYKYYPDGIYMELARTFSDGVAKLTAVRLGTFEWSADGTLTLHQASASPNIEFGEPFARTQVVETRSVSGDFAHGYAARLTARTAAGKPQRTPDAVEQCRRDEAAGASMDRLRNELHAQLPRVPATPPAAKGAAAN